jgi:DNA polymerase-3 subunit gamma/tau
MSYLVLARKYRPQTLTDLIGQEHISRTLGNAIDSGRVHHAFLFTGARGVGKTSAARILAKALNCEQGASAEPCDQCASCEEIVAGQGADVFEIDGASNTGVDDIRDLRDNLRYLPAHSRYKIFIIDEVHMLSINAFNALLKTLEEPPEHVKFIFATTEPHKIPVTILSRCQRLDFRKISLGKVAQRLREIVDAEKIDISDRALSLVARQGEGSMRDALSTLDQVIAFCGETATDEDVLSLLGMVDRHLLFEIVDAILHRDGHRVLNGLQRVDDLGYSYRQFCRELISLFRTLILFKVVDDPTELVDVTADELQTTKTLSELAGLEDLQRMMSLLIRTETEIPGSVFPRLTVEMALVRLTSLPPAQDVAALVRKLEGLERKLDASGIPSQPAPVRRPVPAQPSQPDPPDEPPIPPEPAESTVKKAEAPVAQMRQDRDWPGLVDHVRAKRKPRIASILEQARLLSMELPLLRFGLPKGSFAFGQLEDQETLNTLTELAEAYYEQSVTVKVVGLDASDSQDAPKSLAEERQSKQSDRQNRLRDDALEHPAIKSALEVFEGTVEEVRPIDKGYV